MNWSVVLLGYSASVTSDMCATDTWLSAGAGAAGVVGAARLANHVAHRGSREGPVRHQPAGVPAAWRVQVPMATLRIR